MIGGVSYGSVRYCILLQSTDMVEYYDAIDHLKVCRLYTIHLTFSVKGIFNFFFFF